MRRSLFIAFLIGVLNVAAVNAALLSGSISLPSGRVASGSGSQFIVSTQPFLGVQSAVTIPVSQSTANFSLNLPNGASYRVRFDCVSGCGGLDFTTAGFWSQMSGIVGLESNATSYLSAQSQNVNIQLEDADTFSGTIILPEGFQATGDESLLAIVSASTFGQAATFQQTITTQEGETNWPFTIGVPADATGGGWNVNVQCQNCDVDITAEPHYPTTVIGDPASLEISSQFFYLKNRDYRDMSMTLISIAKPEPEDSEFIVAPIILLLDD